MLALVTDYDCWHPDHDAVTVETVIATMHANSSMAQRNHPPSHPTHRPQGSTALPIMPWQWRL
jgi:hypothetical protein